MNDQNTPYAPPASDIGTGQGESLPIVPASRWLRLANLFIDYIALIILGIIIGILITVVFGESAIRTIDSLPGFIVGAPILIVYYLVFEGLLHRSLAKYVTGTKVVNEFGQAPTFGQIVGRTFSRLIPFEQVSFLGSKGRGLHDSLANTYVVRCR